MKSDGINRIYRIGSYPVHPVNPVKINEVNFPIVKT